jgi:NADPH-dependent glutamate synthase beta subunit-like oxidoreductase
VKFRPNRRIGPYITGEDLFNDGYDAVFVATGAVRPHRLGLLGEILGHVAFAVDYLKSPDSYRLGRKVVVVGAGNVAVDAARTALRKGSSDVTLLNFMGPEEVSAHQDEVEPARVRRRGQRQRAAHAGGGRGAREGGCTGARRGLLPGAGTGGRPTVGSGRLRS